MNWKKAKNFIILLLLLLNLLLISTNYTKLQKYKSQATQEQAIKKILSQNNIKLEAQLPGNFQPMKAIKLKTPEWDIEQLKDAFWTKNADIKRTVEFDKTILIKDKETITIQNNTIIYNNPVGTDKLENINKETALKHAGEYIRKLNTWFPNTIQDEIKENNGTYTITYLATHQRKPIFNNNINITITKNGITNLQMNYLKPEQFTGSKKDIYSADEAIFIVLQDIKEQNNDVQITIKKIDLGYGEEKTNPPADNITAVPYYRILTNENNRTYKVNAYTGKIRDKS